MDPFTFRHNKGVALKLYRTSKSAETQHSSRDLSFGKSIMCSESGGAEAVSFSGYCRCRLVCRRVLFYVVLIAHRFLGIAPKLRILRPYPCPSRRRTLTPDVKYSHLVGVTHWWRCILNRANYSWRRTPSCPVISILSILCLKLPFHCNTNHAPG